MTYQTLLYERRGPVGLLTLNRPAVLNAIDATMIGELNQAMDAIEADVTVRALVLTGAGDIAVMDKSAVAMTKQAINRSYDIMGMREALAMALDTDVLIESMDTPESVQFAEIARRDGLKAA